MVPLCQLLLLNNLFVIVFCVFMFSILYQFCVCECFVVCPCLCLCYFALCSSLMLYSIISIAIVSVFCSNLLLLCQHLGLYLCLSIFLIIIIAKLTYPLQHLQIYNYRYVGIVYHNVSVCH